MRRLYEEIRHRTWPVMEEAIGLYVDTNGVHVSSLPHWLANEGVVVRKDEVNCAARTVVQRILTIWGWRQYYMSDNSIAFPSTVVVYGDPTKKAEEPHARIYGLGQLFSHAEYLDILIQIAGITSPRFLARSANQYGDGHIVNKWETARDEVVLKLQEWYIDVTVYQNEVRVTSEGGAVTVIQDDQSPPTAVTYLTHNHWLV